MKRLFAGMGLLGLGFISGWFVANSSKPLIPENWYDTFTMMLVQLTDKEPAEPLDKVLAELGLESQAEPATEPALV